MVYFEGASDKTGRVKQRHTLLLFFLLFGLYFCVLPLSGSLPGKVDSWFYVSTFEYLSHRLSAFIHGQPFGNCLYPETSHLPFGNFSPGLGLIYWIFRSLGLNILWSSWAITVIIFASNAIGVTLLARILKISWPYAWVAGLVVAFNNYTIANIDNLDALFWSPGLLSISCILLYANGKKQFLIPSFILLGIQITVSSYLFVISAILWIPILVQLAQKKQLISKLPELALTSLILLLFVAPFGYLYFVKGGLTDSYNPADAEGVWAFTGLHLQDLFTYLPHSLYSTFFHTASNDWNDKTHCVGIGFLFPIIGLIGLGKFKSGFPYGKWVALFFLLLAIGARISMNDNVYITPVYPLMKTLGFEHLFRINIRAIQPVILLLGLGMAGLLQKYGNKVLFLVAAIILVENVPAKLRTYPSLQIIEHVESAVQFAQLDPMDIVLNLPSSFYSDQYPGFVKLNLKPIDIEVEVVREFSYMLFQAETGTRVINGFNGFIPKSRMTNQMNILMLDNDSCRETLVRTNEIEYILLHLDWLDKDSPSGGRAYFQNVLKNYTEVRKNDHFILYRTNLK